MTVDFNDSTVGNFTEECAGALSKSRMFNGLCSTGQAAVNVNDSTMGDGTT